MKRRLSALFLTFALLLSVALTVSAETPALVVDPINLLTEQEEQALTDKAASLRDKYGMDVVIVTNQSLDGKTPEQYADDYYDYNGYGPDGVLFLLSMGERDWYISTSGDCIYALTDYGIQKLGEAAVPYLGSGEYYKAFNAYLDALGPYFERFQEGDPIDGWASESDDFYVGTREEVVHYHSSTPPFGTRLLQALPSSILFGLIVAFVLLMVQRSKMKAKRSRTAAAIYMVDNSYRMGRRSDTFLYTNTTKTRIQESSSSGSSHSSSGGGSSTHHSSSGSSHGGGGGKF